MDIGKVLGIVKNIWDSKQNTMDIVDILVIVYDIGKTV